MRNFLYGLITTFLLSTPSAALVPLGAELAERPVFLCGPGDPEDFLYRADQQAFIDNLVANGGNTAYVQIVRSHGGDDLTGTHNPWIGGDPALGLDVAKLDQWDAWFTQMDAAGIVVYLFLYDDGAAPFGTGDALAPEEVGFIEAVVNRFEHLDNLVWTLCEECDQTFSAAHIKDMASVIRGADDNRHAIAVHLLNGLDFTSFADDPNIDQFAVQMTGAGPDDFNASLATARSAAAGRYSVILAEGHPDAFGEAARLRSWAAAMAGTGIMHIRWIDPDPADLADCRVLASFMRRTDYPLLAPDNARAFGGSTYVLAGRSYVLYGTAGVVGVTALPAGDYDLLWLDIATGAFLREQGVPFTGGDTALASPLGFDSEIAVWMTPGRTLAAVTPPPPPPPPPAPDPDPGVSNMIVTGTCPTRDQTTWQPLEGQVLSGLVCILVTPENVVSNPATVDFSVDGVVIQREKNTPYDLCGGSSSAANPCDLSSAPFGPGVHVIEASLPFSGGTRTTVRATFTVQ